MDQALEKDQGIGLLSERVQEGRLEAMPRTPGAGDTGAAVGTGGAGTASETGAGFEMSRGNFTQKDEAKPDDLTERTDSRKKAMARDRRSALGEARRKDASNGLGGPAMGPVDAPLALAAPTEPADKAAAGADAGDDPFPGGSPRAGDAPKRSGAILDGIVVPSIAAEVQREESLSLAEAPAEAQVMEMAGAAPQSDGFLDAEGGAVSSGTFRGHDEDRDTVAGTVEPRYLTRPEAVEAPGAPARVEAVALTTGAGEDDGGLAREKKAVEALAAKEEEEAEATPAEVCAALARNLAEARTREDWPLAEKLAGQMLAKGCTAAAGDDALEDQVETYRRKAVETDETGPADKGKAGPPPSD
jgi:hypothetical protein